MSMVVSVAIASIALIAAGPFASDSSAVAPDDTIPAAPTGLTADPGSGRIALAWTASGEPDLTGYNVYRSDLAAGPTVTVSAAGDIASCSSAGDEATASLLDTIGGDVLTLGDNAYGAGTADEFGSCFEPSWGRHKVRIHPAAGNHEYNTPGATGYFGYFGAAAGDPSKGYYSYDDGSWHVVVLNSGDCAVVSCAAGSQQETWLRADLAASHAACTLAVFHHPRFSSGTTHGSSASMQPFYQALYDFNADLILNGHEHLYERFAPLTPTGAVDPVRGIREIVVGTGGGGTHYPFGTILPGSEARNNDAFGVLTLQLGPAGYDWRFVPEAGKTFTDTGSTACHDAAGSIRAPGTPLNGTTLLTAPSFTDTSVVNGTTYHYTVTAVDAAGQESPPSTEIAARPTAPTPTSYASDAFGRTLASGWGSADAGGSYTLLGPAADFGTSGGVGTMTLPAAGANRAATLTAVSASDVDLSLRAATNKAATGSGAYVYGVVRRVSSTSEYRVKLRFATTGGVFFQATAVIANKEASIGNEVQLAGVTLPPGSFVRVRAQVSGASPTTIRIRAWRDGTAEPSTWPFTASDSSAALQGAGAIGVRSYLSSTTTNAPVVVSFDDVRAANIGAAGTAPVVDSVTISPGAPRTDQVLTASYAAHDAEGDDLSASYQWTRNGVDLSGATASTLDLAVPGRGDRGDVIRVRVTVDDGTASSAAVSSSPVTVADSPPVLSTSFADRTDAEGGAPILDADASDLDADPLTYTATGLPHGLSINGANGVVSGTIAYDAAGAHAVAITATDGSLSDTRSFGWTVTETDAPPTATVTLTPQNPGTDDTLTATATATDPDGDPVGLTFVWKVAGTIRRTFSTGIATTDSFDLAVPGNGDPGDAVRVEVTPTSRSLTGATTSAQVTVAGFASPVLADDAFSRTIAGGWGSAVSGGAYTLQGPATDYAVDGAVGTMRLTGGALRSAVLTSVSARDVDLGFRLAVDKLPAGSSQYAYGIARRVSSSAEIRAKVRIASDGAVYLQAGSVTANAETGIGSEVRVTGLTMTRGAFVRFRTQVTGASPTTIRIRVWADGGTEPTTWQSSGTTSAAGLQVAGAVGLRAYTSSTITNAPITLRFDDVRVTGVVGP